MDIRFDICNKKRLGTLFRRGDTGIGGKKAKVNIDLRAVNKLEVNHKTEFMTMTDDVKIVNNNTGEILIPFKPELIDVGTNSFEVVAYMENGDIKTSQTYVYSVSESIGNNRPTVSTRTVNKPNILTSDINARVTEYTIGDIRVYPIVVDMDTVDDINTTLKFKQYDFGTSHLLLQLFEGDTPLHLKNTSVVASFLNAYDDLIIDTVSYTSEETIISEIDGVIKVLIPKDVIRYEGDVKCEVLLFDALENRTTSPRISFSIVESLNNHEDSSEIIDTEKYTVLSTLMKNVGVLQESANTLITQNKALSVDLRNSEAIRVSNENTRITNENKRIEQHTNRLSEMTNSITNIEKRFTTLTTSQQQDAELIDARDGEDSLKLRLERDLAKGKVIEEDVEGSYITIADSVEGNITNIEIPGNTVQNATNLADIKSVGIKKEDGTYEMSILSCGKNLFSGGFEIGALGATGQIDTGAKDYCASYFTKIPNIQNITCSCNYKIEFIYFYDNNKNFISRVQINLTSKSVTVPNNSRYVRFRFRSQSGNFDLSKISWLQLEEGTQATQYEPYKSNKCDILLPCQLEKVGDVADRLFRREDGVWCVEKKIETRTYTSKDNWLYSSTQDVMYLENLQTNVLNGTYCVNTLYSYKSSTNSVMFVTNGNVLRVYVNKEYTTVTDFKSKLDSISGIEIKYPLITPQIIELPLSTQIALNSFFGTTNMWLESGEVEGTIKATVPKSLGASVQSLSTKTDILSDRVEAIEGLKDSQNMTYQTNKGYLVCEETRNSVVKDVKLEGRTLVNLWGNKASDFTPSGQTTFNEVTKFLEYTSTTSRFTNWFLNDFSRFKPNTLYTFIVEVTENTFPSSNTNAIRVTSLSAPGATTVGVFEHDFSIKGGQTGIFVKSLTSVSDFSSASLGVRSYIDNIDGTVGAKVKIRLTIIEGDHTQNPPSYFEGLKSVGQDVDVIEVSTRKEDGNLFDKDSLISESSNIVERRLEEDRDIIKFTQNSNSLCIKNRWLANTSYYISFEGKSLGGGLSLTVNYTDGTTQDITTYSTSFAKLELTTTSNKSISSVISKYLSSGIQAEIDLNTFIISKNKSVYTPYKSHKKQLLYYNELGELKPIPQLREWDSVYEENGKTYYKVGSGEVVLNGSENWSYSTSGKYFILLDTSIINDIKQNVTFISDKLPHSINPHLDDMIISGGVAEKLKISIKSITRVEEFKTWLQNNNVIATYEKAKPIIYECPNLNLSSYSNETMITLNELVIKPHLEFSITSHINSVVAELKEQTRKNTEDLDKVFRQVTYNVDTNRGYEFVEHTNDGVVKDLKVQGRTLVNLWDKTTFGGATGKGGIIIYYNNKRLTKSIGKVTIKIDTGNIDTTYLKWAIYRRTNNDVNVGYFMIYSSNFDTKLVDFSTDTVSDFDFYAIYINNHNGTSYVPFDEKQIKITILEGDHTQNPPSYFEGLKSAGQDVDVIDVSSNNENYFTFDNLHMKYNNISYNILDTNSIEVFKTSGGTVYDYVAFLMKNLIPNARYEVSAKLTYLGSSSGACAIGVKTSDGSYLGTDVTISNPSVEFVCPQNGQARLHFYPILNSTLASSFRVEDIIVRRVENKGNKFVPNKTHKKQLLYYNELGELKPIPQLREWDSVYEENGKTYYRVGSGEVVLNGSENWMLNGTHSKFIDYTSSKLGIKNSICMSDKISLHLGIAAANTKNPIGIRPITNGIRLKPFEKDDMTLEEGKAWLQTNPITVVYELETPKVYECPNLNLSSYSNETMISLNSGAINPRMEFSITSHINELVKNNQARIKELEQRMINMFKQILSGDVQSLAYELYPEDFKTDIAYDVELL